MSSLSAMLERLPPTWKAILALAAMGVVGFTARGFLDSQVGLPARVYAVEAVVKDSLILPRVRVLEQATARNRALIDSGAAADARREAKLDSIARVTCLTLAELRDRSALDCIR